MFSLKLICPYSKTYIFIIYPAGPFGCAGYFFLTCLQKPFPEIISVDYFIFHWLVRIEKCLRKLRFCVWIPFKFKCMKLSFGFFYIIHFCFGFIAPKKRRAVKSPVSECLDTLTHQEVFPKAANIIPGLYWRIVADQGIPDAIIIKINFPA